MSEPRTETPKEARKSGMSRTLSAKKKKILIIIAAIAVIVGGGLGGAWYAGVLEDGESAEAGSGKAPQPVYYELPEFVVNLNTGGRRTTFFKLRASLELDSPTSVAHVEARLPLIVDHFQIYLRELRPEELNGSAGTYRLREELLKRVQLTVAPVAVTDVVFGEMLVN
jgi:flagellar protein FliL